MSSLLIPTRARPALHGQLASSAHHAAGASSLSAGAVVAVIAAGIVILACLAWAAARWWAYEPRWLPAARHACAEAGLRLSATWGELRDWMRLGH
jgi:hypothetical protein